MQLPKNYYWIPGYENRYAMEYDPKNHYINSVVYSFVYPGWNGRPRSIESKGNSQYCLSKNGRKATFDVIHLKQMVTESIAFKHEVLLRSAINSQQPVKPGKTNSAIWIIGAVVNGAIELLTAPTEHATEESAYTDVAELAALKPGREFIVFKSVRKAVSGGIQITDM